MSKKATLLSIYLLALVLPAAAFGQEVLPQPEP
jgi:hypothetical protein